MKGFEVERTELAENPATRCACVVAVDVSSSMSGQPIAELNEGLKEFYREIANDEVAKYSVEPGIVTFSSGASVATQINSTDGPVPPTLHAAGCTDLGKGLTLALDLLQARKALYKQAGLAYYQPWLVLMTDGQPTDDWRSAAQRVHELSSQGKLVFLGIAIGDNADIDTMRQICPPNRPPARLKELNFREFFQWLSQSMKAVSGSLQGTSLQLPDRSGWDYIAAV